MERVVIPRWLIFSLVGAALLLAGCSGAAKSTVRKNEFSPCPQMDLRVPCGRTPAGNYFRL